MWSDWCAHEAIAYSHANRSHCRRPVPVDHSWFFKFTQIQSLFFPTRFSTWQHRRQWIVWMPNHLRVISDRDTESEFICKLTHEILLKNKWRVDDGDGVACQSNKNAMYEVIRENKAWFCRNERTRILFLFFSSSVRSRCAPTNCFWNLRRNKRAHHQIDLYFIEYFFWLSVVVIVVQHHRLLVTLEFFSSWNRGQNEHDEERNASTQQQFESIQFVWHLQKWLDDQAFPE